MKKKTEKLHRLIQKLSARYGDKDEDVLRLQIELDALVKMEKAAGEAKSAALLASKGPTPAKLLYLESLRASRQ